MTNDKKKFTPGPWEVEEPEESSFIDVRVVLGFGNSFDYNPRIGYGNKEQALRDAHLIAASPLMYEALKAVQNDMKQIGTLHPDTDYLVTKALSAVEGKE